MARGRPKGRGKAAKEAALVKEDVAKQDETAVEPELNANQLDLMDGVEPTSNHNEDGLNHGGVDPFAVVAQENATNDEVDIDMKPEDWTTDAQNDVLDMAPGHDKEPTRIQSVPVTEEEAEKVRQLVDFIIQFGSKTDEMVDSDEEEGAIEEEEVPFERIQETEVHSTIVHLLNMPPEVDLEALVTAAPSVSDIIHHCFTVNNTQLKITFVSGALAKEARRLLDYAKIRNRTIQAVLSNQDDIKHQHRDHMQQHGHGGKPFVPLPLMPLPPNRRGGRPVPPLIPGFPLPPLPPGMVPPISPRKMPPRPLLPMPLVPPRKAGEGSDRSPMYGVPMPHGAQGIPPHQHMKLQFGRNLSKREGKSLCELLEAMPQVSQWLPDQTPEEQQRHYDDINAEYGITNRYMIIGGLPESATETISAACEWISTHTKKKVEVEICQMEQYALDKGVENDKFLHITFQRRADCSELFTTIITNCPGVICKYAAPRKAFDTIWMGNLTDLFSYCRDELEIKELCARIGELRVFRYSPDKSCCFVTYASIEDAIKARNRLLGISFTPVKSLALNVDFTLDLAPRFPKKSRLPQDYRGSERGDLSQKLGERLLSALQRRSDGDIVIRQLLDGKEGDAVNLLAKQGGRPGQYPPYDGGRPGPYSRQPPCGQHSPPYGRTPWSRNRNKRTYSPIPPPPEHYKHRKYDTGHEDVYEEDMRRGKDEYDDVNVTGSPHTESTSYNQDKRQTPQPKESPQAKQKPSKTYMCDLLKRGKPICKVSAIFVRGDVSHRVPQVLDVNQRANPERLANYLQKGPELSLWQLGAENSEDSVKYDGLCEYLVSKKRVALVQEGPYEIYIVPPSDTYSMVPNLPDTQFMYAYILPKGT